MILTTRNIVVLLIITFAGIAGSTIIGLMTYGGEVFNTKSAAFAFLAYGLSGGFIFAFYHVRGLSETITAAVIVSAIQFAISTTWISLLNAAIWSFGINLPIILLAFVFERKLAYFHQWKFIVVALVYGAMFVMLTLLVALLTGVETMPAVVFRQNFVDGMLIGLGVGIGVEAGEALVHSLEHGHAAPHAV